MNLQPRVLPAPMSLMNFQSRVLRVPPPILMMICPSRSLVLPRLRRAVQLEIDATAKAKAAKAAKAKDKMKDKKNKNTIYGYLPMAGVFVDEDQKKGDDHDQHDIIV